MLRRLLVGFKYERSRTVKAIKFNSRRKTLYNAKTLDYKHTILYVTQLTEKKTTQQHIRMTWLWLIFYPQLST